jgi:hypothetical protein
MGLPPCHANSQWPANPPCYLPCPVYVRSLISGASVCAPDSKYVLFLDDDTEMHPGCLAELVALLERDPSLFMATGGWGGGGGGGHTHCAPHWGHSISSACHHTLFMWLTISTHTRTRSRTHARTLSFTHSWEVQATHLTSPYPVPP